MLLAQADFIVNSDYVGFVVDAAALGRMLWMFWFLGPDHIRPSAPQ
jgi:hypothetical protein